jgi:hypothetical protein
MFSEAHPIYIGGKCKIPSINYLNKRTQNIKAGATQALKSIAIVGTVEECVKVQRDFSCKHKRWKEKEK